MTEKQKLDPAVVRISFAVITGALAVVFDTTIVSVALHTLATELHTSVDTIQWVSTGYLLALGVTIPLVGWAQQRFGGKRLWMLALTIFLIGSILCSMAWDAPSLIAFRVLQGVGGGMMLPLMSTLVMQAAHGQNLGRIMATVGLPAVLGPILGPVIGGLILSAFDWRWLFWVNVPFCVVGLILAATLLPKDVPGKNVRLDIVGLVLLSPSMVGILYGLSNVSRDGGFGRLDVLIPLIAGVLLLVAFAFWAARLAGSALVDVRLFRHRPVASASALMFLSGASLYGAMLLLPLYFQEVRGMEALGAGLMLVPQGIGTLFSRTLAGRLTDRIGARWVTLVGFAIVGIATIPFAFATPTTNEWLLMGALLLRGFGLGAVTIPLMAVAFVGLERSDVPHASVLTRIAQQVGGSFGVALLAVILQGAAVGAHGLAGIADAFDVAFWWAVGFTVLAVALSLLLPAAAAPAPSPAVAPAPAAPPAAGELTASANP
ncbi:MDR family MFS transporter [Leifsonia poae]|uniref:MDR family MFS transporter n=1 Tax=Leifsonia poae TaxID=110933 RepID=UPI001CBC6F8F|nr:MDR family MFS transporter [Leifsonia poae]